MRVPFWIAALMLAVHAGAMAACSPGPDPAGFALAREPGWRCESEQDSLRVYSRPGRGQRVSEVLATALVEGSARRLYDVIRDYRNYPSFMPYVQDAQVLREISGETWVFQQLRFPIPFLSGRYYTIRLVHQEDPTAGRYRVEWNLADDAAPPGRGEGVAVRLNRGAWELRRTPGGQAVAVSYFLLTDPGENVPAWVADLANTTALPKVLEAVAARAGARLR